MPFRVARISQLSSVTLHRLAQHIVMRAIQAFRFASEQESQKPLQEQITKP